MRSGLKFGVHRTGGHRRRRPQDAARVPPRGAGDSATVRPPDGRLPGWDVNSADARVNEPVHSDLPALASTFDAITQASLADVVAHTLPNSTTVRFPAIGQDAATNVFAIWACFTENAFSSVLYAGAGWTSDLALTSRIA